MKRKMMITAVVLTAAMIGGGARAVLAERGPMPGFGGPPPGIERGADNFEARMAKIFKLTDTHLP